VPTITLANGKEFSAEINETILNAALRSGLVLEHSCKTGRCGSCKVQVCTGLTTPIVDELGLNPIERNAGWILSCVRSAASDAHLNVEDLGDIKIYPTKTLPCRIQSLERLSTDVLRVILRLPPNQQLDYHPGQYIDVIGKDGLRRSYSIANAPTSDKLIELHIRHVPEGTMSRYWFDEAKTSDLLRLNGPLGTFFLRDPSGLDLILLATGTGMAPIKAILEGMGSWSKERLPRSINVYWGGRIPQDFYWNPTEVGINLRYFPVLSRANSVWSGLRGYVQQAVLKSDIHLEHAVVYACGSVAMIDSARTQMVAAGLNVRRFYSDAFVSSSQNKMDPL